MGKIVSQLLHLSAEAGDGWALRPRIQELPTYNAGKTSFNSNPWWNLI